MTILKAIMAFAATFVMVSLLGHAVPALPQAVSTAWAEARHAAGFAQTHRSLADGTQALSLAPDRMGHFFVRAEALDGGVEMIVDSGASYVGLTHADAARLGLHPGPGDFTLEVETANGVLHLAPVLLPELRLGHITIENVPATISPEGTLHASLLGMSALARLERVEFTASEMLLVP